MTRVCLWCGNLVAPAEPRICSARCFNLARLFGWFEAKRLWARAEVDALMRMEDAG